MLPEKKSFNYFHSASFQENISFSVCLTWCIKITKTKMEKNNYIDTNKQIKMTKHKNN